MGKIYGRVWLIVAWWANIGNMPLMGREQLHAMLGLFGGDFAQHGIARAPFHHRDESPGAQASHHQVDFPIADATFFLHDGRSLVNANPVFNLPSGIGLSIAFLAFLLTVAQMAIQRTARLAIRLDVLVDALRTQSKTVGRRRRPAICLLHS